LHVLSTPPAFVLSQDQTLRQNLKPTPPPPKEGRPARSAQTKEPETRPNKNRQPPPPKKRRRHQSKFLLQYRGRAQEDRKKTRAPTPPTTPHPHTHPTRADTPTEDRGNRQTNNHRRHTVEFSKNTPTKGNPARVTRTAHAVKLPARPRRKHTRHSRAPEPRGARPLRLNKSYRPAPTNTNQQVTGVLLGV
jgi:hypothetical protein